MKTYVLTGLCYLGLAPEIGWLGWAGGSPFHRRHIQNGLVLSFLGICLLVYCLIVQLLEYLIVSHAPVINFGLVYVLDVASFGPLVGWLVLLLLSLWRSLRHPDGGTPLLSRLARRSAILRCALCTVIAWQALVILVIGVSLRANYLARPHRGPASVYMLYENVVYYPLPVIGNVTFGVPEWFFPVAFYPIEEISAARWGDGSITVAPLTRAGLNDAFQHGRFVFVASHGGWKEGTISLSGSPGEQYSPEELQPAGGVGSGLRLVYLAGCNAGSLEAQWIQALAPARVILFHRISWVNEHLYWLWFDGPQAVLELK